VRRRNRVILLDNVAVLARTLARCVRIVATLRPRFTAASTTLNPRNRSAARIASDRVGEDGRIRRRLGERVRDLENDGRAPNVRTQRAGSGWDSHEDEVRLAGWAAQVQRAGDPWCTVRAGRAGENRPELRGKGGRCSTQSVSASAQPVGLVEQR
jgi:hypothetical protein